MDDRRHTARCPLQAECRVGGKPARILDISDDGVRLEVPAVAGSLVHLSWYLNGYHLDRPLRVRWMQQVTEGHIQVGATFTGNAERDTTLQKFVRFARWLHRATA